MRKFILPGHATLAALFLGSALTLAACAPAPMDAGNGGGSSGGSSGSNSGGSSGGSNSGGSSGGSNSGGSSGGSNSGGSSGSSNSGGSSGSSNSGGSSGSSSGGSSGGSKSGGSSGSSSGGSSGSSSGGSSGSSSGGSSGMADAGPPAAGGQTFTDLYTSVLKPNCTPCHDVAHDKIIMKDKAMAFATLTGTAGIVMAGMPDKSKLVTEITPQGGKPPAMPKMKTPLSMADVDKVKAWITAGAKDD
jgi:hypothetical protein